MTILKLNHLSASSNHESHTTLTTSHISNKSHLIDKIVDLTSENREVGLIIGSAIATSIIIYVTTKSITQIIIALRSNK